MDVFELNRRVIDHYKSFSRSFTTIEAPDLRAAVDAAYEGRRYTPEPLISMNPRYKAGDTVATLADGGTIDPATARIFSIAGKPITLHKHQQQAAAKAAGRESFVVTTGTGSGKSLCFFLPIIDQAVRARQAGEPRRTRAIIVYPMNALANSQKEEIEKFIRDAGLPDAPRVARYTGQESTAERKEVAENPPDILLTNFVMLELLMTRGDALGRKVIQHCAGLDWLVLDELHTYRGRQGADVAMLVRRMREALGGEDGRTFRCIGTSATMGTGNEEEKKASVAEVATKLFATTLDPSQVITETLERATDGKVDNAALRAAVENVDLSLPDQVLKTHPLAIWAELRIGLIEAEVRARRPPVQLAEAVERLAVDTGLPTDLCGTALAETLLACSMPENQRGGPGDKAFLAFKLHQFISGPESLYATLAPRGERRMTLEKQTYHPDDDALLFETRFCRACGQDYHPVRFDGERIEARPIDDEARDEEDGSEIGFAAVIHDDLKFSDEPENYPEAWQEQAANGDIRLRANRKKQRALQVSVNKFGVADPLDGTATPLWYLPGRFSHCIFCQDTPPPQGRDINKLAGLSAEGRSSATTMITTDILRVENDLGHPEEMQKLLVFTDNRQDAALQAGHFNDTTFVTRLRAGFLAALRAAGPDGLGDENLGVSLASALGFVHANEDRRIEWMSNPRAKGAGPKNAEAAMRDLLAHRAWADQRRGWRFTNPNLEELGLLRAEYPYLEEMAADLSELTGAPDVILEADDASRRIAFREILETMRRGLAIDTEALRDAQAQEIARNSRTHLCSPWSFDEKEEPYGATWLVVEPLPYKERKPSDERLLLRGGSMSRMGKALSAPSLWGRKLDRAEYGQAIEAFLGALKVYDLVSDERTSFGPNGWRIKRSGIRFHAGSGTRPDGRPVNPYFHDLYSNLAGALAAGEPVLRGVEAREHTAQVSKELRQHRERRFRYKEPDKKEMKEQPHPDESQWRLPILVCSPTMELGVDISALDTVFMRNVPPTPANYTQRAGRAGRAGQAALIQTYCASQSPHDRYYFEDPARMVNGIVRAPMLDLENVDLVTAHLHAVWLSTAKIELAPAIAEVLDLKREGYPVSGEVEEVLSTRDLAETSIPRMNAVLDQLGVDRSRFPSDFAEKTAVEAWASFDKAFESWRNRLKAAEAQRNRAHEISSSHGISRDEKRAADMAYDSARRQISLLTTGKDTQSSDFFTYRYLATEGFLPGYNFPRLPLTAFVPGKRGERGGGDYLSRARFLAISEFGPMSLVYHEGQAYRVVRAMLPPGTRDDSGRSLSTDVLKICSDCGALQKNKAPETCEACGASMSDYQEIKDAFRIENVETAPAERISANDEDRQRQGFEIQTTFSWHHPEQLERIELRDDEGSVAEFAYGPSATIVRINKGLRRRADKSELGYKIEVQSGRWAGSVSKPGEDDPDNPLVGAKVRIVPMVEDRKNALLLRFDPGLLDGRDNDTIGTFATLQSALARGIELVFQLEEGEIAVEPMPNRDERRALLIYEAAEGGAGVLARFGDRLPEVARVALERMHRRETEEGWVEDDPPCIAGCYQCLLSYFNQPEHALIDRRDENAIAVLARLASSRSVRAQTPEPSPKTSAGMETPWSAAARRWGLIAPDARQAEVEGEETLAIWRDYTLAVVSDPVGKLAAALDGQGIKPVAGSREPPETMPPQLETLREISTEEPA